MRLVSFTLSGLLAFISLAGADEYTPAATKVATSTVAKVSAPAAVVPKAAVIGADYRFGAENFGYFVVDLADGHMVAELNADEPFMPASVCKVPTMGAALDILGADHRFETTVLIEGEVINGVLDGVLTLRGGGDPLLTGDDLMELAKDIAAAGITQVDGEFRYDATALVETPQINALQPEVVGYNPGVSALSVNFNRVRITWRNGDKGPSGEARAVSDGLTLALDMIHFAPADEPLPGPFAHVGAPSEDSWVISPEISSSGEDWLPVRDSALIAAEMLYLLAAKEGIRLPEPTPGTAGPEAREIAHHASPDLAEIVRRVLNSSNNLAAELIGLAASQAATDQPLTLEDSAATVANHWRQRIPDIDWDDFFMENQSGLSSKSRATPRQLVAILQAAADPAGGAELYQLLRSASWKAPNGKTVRIRAKTGTIAYGRGLAGYIDAVDGRRLAFAVFFNDFERRAAIDAAFDPRVDARDPEWRGWRARALKLEETLLNGWATGS